MCGMKSTFHNNKEENVPGSLAMQIFIKILETATYVNEMECVQNHWQRNSFVL